MAANPNISWRVNERGELKAFAGKQEIIWYPQPGGQEAFLRCTVEEAVLEGNRGGGKSEALLMDFGQHVGQGWGEDWKGILFRRTFPELDDIVAKSRKWFPKIWPKAQFNIQKMQWEWPTGEMLMFRHMMRENDYWSYHGHCLDEGDVLTPDRGWVSIVDIQPGDSVYAVDQDRNLQLSKVACKTEEDYTGDLIRHVGRGTYLSFTPQHKLGTPTTSGLTPVAYEDLPRETSVARWVNFKGGSQSVPEGCPTSNFVEYCEFMGWFLSEGWTYGGKLSKHRDRWGIAQSKPEGRATIKDLLTRMGIRQWWSTNGVVVADRAWYDYLVQFGKCRDKWIPREILNASTFHQQVFFNALMAGDGTWQDDNAYYFTISSKLADDVSELASKLGYAVEVSSRSRSGRDGESYTVSCRSGDRRDLRLYTDNRERQPRGLSQKTQVQRVRYTGKVYCIGIPETHMFLVRQRGCVWISGNSYPWIAFEELTTWADPGCFTRMMSCCRSARPGMPRKIRATTNPYGPGHTWVKRRYRLPMGPYNIIGPVIRDAKNKAGDLEPPRVAIKVRLSDNKIMLFADPMYVQRIKAAARNAAELAAWVDGSWDITSGGIIDDIWDENIHIVPDIEADQIPKGWRINRAYDHGQSKPFSVGWWMESNGEPIETEDGRLIGSKKGDLIRLAEWYGWNGEDNEGLRMTGREIAVGIKEREVEMGIRTRVCRGPADSQIFSKYDGTKSVAGDMQSQGISWDPIDKSSGSREQGWQKLRDYLKNAIPGEDGTREGAGLFVCARNSQFLRTVPCLPRDQKKIDDVDSDCEDHIGDEVRYRLRWTRKTMKVKGWR